MPLVTARMQSNIIFSEIHDVGGGSRDNVHGIIYQLKLHMLFLRRGLDKGYTFQQANDRTAAEKFDDLVFKYEKNGDCRYRFIQAKHIQEEETKISRQDLLTTAKNAKFTLQKYFISYRKIKQNPLFQGGSFDDLVIATNIDLDDKLKQYFTEVTDDDVLLVVKFDLKGSKRYKLNEDPSNTFKNDIVENLRS